MPESEYPEHEKMAAVHEQSQAQGEFLEWLANAKGFVLCERNTLDWGDDRFVPADQNVERLLAEYHDIDLEKVEAEKRAMLDRCRRQP